MRAESQERQEKSLRSAWLCCPHCGDSKQLHKAEDLPSEVTHILSPCPDCSDKPADETTVYVYDMEIRDEHRQHLSH
jgi:hypothetical protein